MPGLGSVSLPVDEVGHGLSRSSPKNFLDKKSSMAAKVFSPPGAASGINRFFVKYYVMRLNVGTTKGTKLVANLPTR